VAKTIGKDKGTAPSPRLPAGSRATVARVARVARVPASTRPNRADQLDETQDQDVALADTDTDERLEVTVADQEEAEEEDGDRELALPSRGTTRVVRREPAPTRRGGPLWAIVRLLLAVPLLGVAMRGVYNSYLELRKVTAPTPREAWNMTLVVMGMSAVVALVLGAADLGLIRFLSWVVSLAH
jgi:preprotein translocase SecE subunit